MFNRFCYLFIGISGAFSVLFGAWLAHAGQSLPAEDISRLTSAWQYQVFHTLALLGLLALYQQVKTSGVQIAIVLMVSGLLLFSGSLYLKTWLSITELSKLAPIGGSVLALSWLSLVSQYWQLKGK